MLLQLAPTTNIIRRIVAGTANGTVTSIIFNISSSMALSLRGLLILECYLLMRHKFKIGMGRNIFPVQVQSISVMQIRQVHFVSGWITNQPSNNEFLKLYVLTSEE